MAALRDQMDVDAVQEPALLSCDEDGADGLLPQLQPSTAKRAKYLGKYRSPFPALKHLEGGHKSNARLKSRCDQTTDLINEPSGDGLWDAIFTQTAMILHRGDVLDGYNVVTYRSKVARQRCAVSTSVWFEIPGGHDA